MPSYATDPARELRAAVDQLSVKTRLAMLAAVRCPATKLIAGGYVGPGGGVCPLLAAHRRGGRAHDRATSSSPFAAAWDDFTATPTGAPRAVSTLERGLLEAMLAESLAAERPAPAPDRVPVTDERGAREPEAGGRAARWARHEPQPGGRAARRDQLEPWAGDGADRNRRAELASRPGWPWLGVYRRYDDYRVAVARALGPGAEGRDEPDHPEETGERAATELVA